MRGINFFKRKPMEVNVYLHNKSDEEIRLLNIIIQNQNKMAISIQELTAKVDNSEELKMLVNRIDKIIVDVKSTV